VSVDAHSEEHLGSIQYDWIAVCESLANAQVRLIRSDLVQQRGNYLFNRGRFAQDYNRRRSHFGMCPQLEAHQEHGQVSL